MHGMMWQAACHTALTNNMKCRGKMKLSTIAVLYIGIIVVTTTSISLLFHILQFNEGITDFTVTGLIFKSKERISTDADNGAISNSSLKEVLWERINNIQDTIDIIKEDIDNAEKKTEAAMKVMENSASRRQDGNRQCHMPKLTIRHPLCEEKVNFLRNAANSRCYEENNVKRDNLCSMLIYLSETESWCPRLPWRKAETNKYTSKPTAKVRYDFTDMLERQMKDSAYEWMRQRIKSMQEDWKTALRSLSKKRDLSTRHRKRILIFFGSIAFTPYIISSAFSGGPLGELLQWSDVITSLYLLGHELVIVNDKDELTTRFVPTPDANGCIQKDMVQKDTFDLVFTDITGAVHLMNSVGPYWSRFWCKIRLLDSFGTEAEFNFPGFNNSDKAYRSIWGELGLNLRQFMTMFPHSPDNTFAGFASDSKEAVNKRNIRHAKKNIGLVYGKEDFFWGYSSRSYLDQIRKHVEIHGTFNMTLKKRPAYIPKYVINHGIVNRKKIEKLLMQSKVFIGFGFPLEGPAPLEAIAHGAAFLNRKFDRPLNRYNDDFLRDKPTRRQLTSQNPYVEQFVGEPYVYTVDMFNLTEVEDAMKQIMRKPLKPFIPYEYTHEGMLERISAQIENMDLCRGSIWPPLNNMVILKGASGKSCKDVCWRKDLVCEPAYWPIVNTREIFAKGKIECLTTNIVERTVAPSYHRPTKTCYFQKQPLLFSCVKSEIGHSRICPCRDYVKGQVALCRGCW